VRRGKIEKGSDSGDCGSKKCRRGYGWDWSKPGVWLESGSRFCVGAVGRNLSSVTVKMFIFNLYTKYIL
jgi:hypothetical protein